MTYRLTREDVHLLDEALNTTISADDDHRAAQLIAPDLRSFDPHWKPSARHCDQATRAVRTARQNAREGALIYDLVDHPDADVVCRVLLRAAYLEQATAWESSVTGDPYDDAGHLDKAAELRRLAHLIDRQYDDHPTEGQVIVYVAQQLEIAREERVSGDARRPRLAATLRELLNEAEPAAAEPLGYRSDEGELIYPVVRGE